jgi:peptidoglycan hydrolase CwlO-like protein
MKTNKKTLKAVSVVLILFFASLWYVSATAAERNIEIRPDKYIDVNSYTQNQTHTRVMDAYERLMDRYMNMAERNVKDIGDDVDTVSKKLDSIDKKLTGIDGRLARIEKALNITPPQQPKPESPGIMKIR